MWGTLEASLNVCVVTIFNSAGGRHHADKNEIPVALKRKLKFLRLCLKKIDILEPYREHGLAVFDATGKLAKRRNDIIHGFISDYNPATKQYTFTGLGSEGDKPLVTGQPKYSVTDIIQIGRDSAVHAVDLTNFCQSLVRAFVG